MPGEVLAPALPPNVDGGSGWQIETTIDRFSQVLYTGPVPSGYAWLVQSVSFSMQTDATAGNRVVTFTARKASDDFLYIASTGLIAPSESGFVTFGLDMEQVSATGLGATGASEWNVGLPLVACLPGTTLRVEFQGAVGVNDKFSTTPRLVVTQWEFTSGGSSPATVVGPALYVPGPAEAAAA